MKVSNDNYINYIRAKKEQIIFQDTLRTESMSNAMTVSSIFIELKINGSGPFWVSQQSLLDPK